MPVLATAPLVLQELSSWSSDQFTFPADRFLGMEPVSLCGFPGGSILEDTANFYQGSPGTSDDKTRDKLNTTASGDEFIEIQQATIEKQKPQRRKIRMTTNLCAP
ncbi:hypothetical protein B0J13DRAFT_622338 [Dactylonectria estremocensis]|uniref:Uncharacterized protein n=1 Tax=Dactylonectria estremocensis TaxID=1079267 RepID=A0A9P9EUZ5_9HYPO|nr:hypothetical protein B0J13DRAFT_622338 [Dactylonectria estremocensis]